MLRSTTTPKIATTQQAGNRPNFGYALKSRTLLSSSTDSDDGNSPLLSESEATNASIESAAISPIEALSVAVPKSASVKPSWMAPSGRKDELMREVLAGLVVSLATIPTSVSYSTIIGLSPLVRIKPI
eukprot:gene29013-38058_t